MLRPEPEWWDRARRLRTHKDPHNPTKPLSYREIARRLEVTRSAVLYALNDNVRERAIAKNCRRWAEKRAAGATTAGRTYDGERAKVRRNVRDEFRANGGTDLKELRKLYEKMGCA